MNTANTELFAEQRVALVTGAARGIGRAIALALFEDGWMQMAVDTDGPRLGRLERPEILVQVADVSDEDAVASAIDATVARWGRLDLLVNDAGISDPVTGPVESLELDTWRRYLDVNLTGALACTKHATPHLKKTQGTIINVASTRASMSEPNCEAYAATKGGLLALTHALSVSLGPEVAVHAISPGWIDVRASDPLVTEDVEPYAAEHHDQHPIGRIGRPEDVADLVRFLSTEAARFMTGQNHVLDGGMTKKMIYR